MTISIDFDDTWTKDFWGWAQVVTVLQSFNHRVVICTNRLPGQSGGMEKAIEIVGADNVYFAGHRLKRPFMESQNVHVDFWIDDNPSMIEDTIIISSI
jgi:hypothetical protein